MVKVITIMDDVYSELYKLKSSKNMSFSELFRYLLSERGKSSNTIIGLAGSVSDMDLDHKAVTNIKRGRGMLGWKSQMAD